MLNTILTNKGREIFSASLSGGEKINILKVAFGDKGSTPNAEHSINATKLINERFRLNIDSLYYPPVTEDNNAIIKITASLLPEQSETMDPIYVREFGLVDINGDFIFIGDTVTTLTKEDGTGAGIEFEFYVTIPTPDKLVKVVLGQTSTDFNDAYKLKLEAIEENATKNSKDSYLLDRANHSGKQGMSTITGLTEALENLKTLLDNKTSKFKGSYSDHATFIEANRKYIDGEEPIAGNVTDSFVDDNYFNNSTSTLWYFLGGADWLDSGKKINEDLEALKKIVTDLVTSVSDTKENLTNGTSLGLFNSISDLPSDPNVDAETLTYIDQTLYYAFVIETLSTWVFKLSRDAEGNIVGGTWVNLNSNVANRFLEVDNKLNNKVDMVAGKTLTSNDYTNLEKEKLTTIEAGAQVNKTVINSLVSDSTDEPLSAKQGKVLKTLIDNINTILSSDKSNLDTLQEIVDFILLNKDTLDNLGMGNIAGLEAALANKQDKLISGTNIKTINNFNITGSGNINLTDKPFKGVREVRKKVTGTVLDLNTANVFTKTLDANTVFSVSNIMPTDSTYGDAVNSFILEVINNNFTITWWDNIKWPGGTAPVPTAVGKDVFGFYTYDSGATWVGGLLFEDVK